MIECCFFREGGSQDDGCTSTGIHGSKQGDGVTRIKKVRNQDFHTVSLPDGNDWHRFIGAQAMYEFFPGTGADGIDFQRDNAVAADGMEADGGTFAEGGFEAEEQKGFCANGFGFGHEH